IVHAYGSSASRQQRCRRAAEAAGAARHDRHLVWPLHQCPLLMAWSGWRPSIPLIGKTPPEKATSIWDRAVGTICTELFHPDHQMRISPAPARAAALATALLFMPPVSGAIDAIIDTPLAPRGIGNLAFISLAQAQPAAPTPSQIEALNAYKNAVNEF